MIGDIAPIASAGELPRDRGGNLLLRMLPDQDRALLDEHLERVPIRSGDRLAESGAPIERVCFPEGGIAGFLDVLADGRRVAIGLLGREGFAGWPALLGNNRWPHEIVARGPDTTALVIDADALHRAVVVSERLRGLLLRYTSSFVTQIASALASNLLQSVEQRLARWLLMYHDRIDGDELTITHDELGIMLGVRRASITDALHQLEGTGAIRALRGRMILQNRAALRALAGPTYGKGEIEYKRLIGEDVVTKGAEGTGY